MRMNLSQGQKCKQSGSNFNGPEVAALEQHGKRKDFLREKEELALGLLGPGE